MSTARECQINDGWEGYGSDFSVKIGDSVKKGYGLGSVAALFVIYSALVLSHPRSFDDESSRTRDCIGWDCLRNQGVYDVPLYCWYGVPTDLDCSVNAGGIYFLELHERPSQDETLRLGGMPGAQARLFLHRARIGLS